MVDFDYTEEQRQLRNETHRFLAARCPLAVPRAALEGNRTAAAALWRDVAAQGWLGVTIPESYGGLGLGHVDLGAIAEEIGAALAPIPFGSTLYLFAEAVMAFGSEEQRAKWLPAIVSGELIGCAALLEHAGPLRADALSVRAIDGRLSGLKQPVVDGGIATHALVLARDDRGCALYVVELDDAGREPLEAIDGSIDVARLSFDDCRAERLAAIDDAALADLLGRAAVLYAFEQIGGADRCLARTTDYVKERQAFGGPVGRFQAVKHKLADLYVANQLARSHAYHGAWAIGAGGDVLATPAAAARIAASDAYWLASKEAIHLAGAIGFTWEHDAHLFYRRAHHLSLNLGAPQWWKERLFAQLAAAA